MALRALVLILVVATFVAAGGERWRRIAAAFDWQGVVVPANFRLDAWVSPPTYTARPPVILPGLRPGEQPPTSVAAVSVPTGSVLVIRASGKVQFDVGDLRRRHRSPRRSASAGAGRHRRTALYRHRPRHRGGARLERARTSPSRSMPFRTSRRPSR